MKRVNIQGANGHYYTNMLLIRNFSDLVEYNEIHLNNVSDAAEDIVKVIKTDKHPTNLLAAACEKMAKLSNAGSLWMLGDISSKAMSGMRKMLLKGYTLCVNPNGGYFLLSDKDIVEEIKDFIYTEKDIKITKFDGGKHYYARVGNISVVDEYGDNKWNTHDYAYNEAVKFLKKLNDGNKNNKK